MGAIPARPGPILVPGIPSRIGPGRAETDFLATSDDCPESRPSQGREVFAFSFIFEANRTSREVWEMEVPHMLYQTLPTSLNKKVA